MDLYCSVCLRTGNIVLVQGTSVCIGCLLEAKKQVKYEQKPSEDIPAQITSQVAKENDIYD